MIPPLPTVEELWPIIRDRVATPELAIVLGGAKRAYIVGDPMPNGLGETVAWGNVAIVPRATLWPQPANPGGMQGVGFLARVEFQDPQRPGYRVDVSLAAAHRLVYLRLVGWAPPVDAMRHAVVATAITIAEIPQPRPLYDDERGLWYTSAQYRLNVLDPAPA